MKETFISTLVSSSPQFAQCHRRILPTDSYFPSGWPKQRLSFWLDVKLVLPRSIKCMNSGVLNIPQPPATSWKLMIVATRQRLKPTEGRLWRTLFTQEKFRVAREEPRKTATHLSVLEHSSELRTRTQYTAWRYDCVPHGHKTNTCTQTQRHANTNQSSRNVHNQTQRKTKRQNRTD